MLPTWPLLWVSGSLCAVIVRPDPPEDLQVSAIPSESKKLLLEWKPPGSWPLPEYFPLKYLIRYTRQGTGSPRTVSASHALAAVEGLRGGIVDGMWLHCPVLDSLW